MRSYGWIFGLVLGLLALSCEDDDDDGTGPAGRDFRATLTGASERPTPITTPATGTATFEVNGQTVEYRIEVDDITGVTAAHIHLGTVDVAGPIVVGLFGQAPPGTGALDDDVLVDSTFTAGSIQPLGGNPPISLDSLLVLMGNGNAYVNVHTVVNPAGEIRGQLED